MGWNYDPGSLATSQKDQVRLEIGDTDPQRQLLQDEEIEHALGTERNFWAAAARCAEMVSRFYLSKADVRLGRALMVTYSKASEQYTTMAKDLRKKALGTVAPYFGGVYVADKQSISGDTSVVAPAFTRTMQENPWTGGYTSDSLPPSESDADDSGVEFE